MFWALDLRRQGNGYAVLPITYLETEAWCRLQGERLAPWELGLLDRMEVERLHLLNKRKDETDWEISDEPLTEGVLGRVLG